ncbi:hypothetical protein B0T18DRAFT_410470 [Schizothecium vesticola]|uniref:Uncharacterized protein n=1 Tax=Schizothecium vesticola TaxID=314040 RepID=A0AA40K4T6_9PEZI|nr:hypothetical protein B0T18DRAFT_410470 [Schizothecium vesticola]
MAYIITHILAVYQKANNRFLGLLILSQQSPKFDSPSIQNHTYQHPAQDDTTKMEPDTTTPPNAITIPHSVAINMAMTPDDTAPEDASISPDVDMPDPLSLPPIPSHTAPEDASISPDVDMPDPLSLPPIPSYTAPSTPSCPRIDDDSNDDYDYHLHTLRAPSPLGASLRGFDDMC